MLNKLIKWLHLRLIALSPEDTLHLQLNYLELRDGVNHLTSTTLYSNDQTIEHMILSMRDCYNWNSANIRSQTSQFYELNRWFVGRDGRIITNRDLFIDIFKKEIWQVNEYLKELYEKETHYDIILISPYLRQLNEIIMKTTNIKAPVFRNEFGKPI